MGLSHPRRARGQAGFAAAPWTGDERTLAATRLASQLLAGPPAPSVEDVVGRLLAVQAQDLRGARLGVRARSSGLAASDVDHALGLERSLVVTWLNRGTLHLVMADDYWWLHRLTTPQLATGNERRLRQEGVSASQADRGVAVVTEAVSSDGPQTRAQLRQRLQAAGVPVAGQALVHVLMAASLGGHVVKGPMIGKEQAYVSTAGWLGVAPDALDRDVALATLARRYLLGHGPASPDDLAKWAGVTLGDARRAFDAVADEVVPAGNGLAVMADRADPGSLPPPRLLGPFDPLLHGWASRELFVGSHGGAVTSNGVFRPVALVDGRVVATWAMPGGAVSIKPLEPIGPKARQALVEDAARVLAYLGLPDRPAAIA